MLENSAKLLQELLSPEKIREIDGWIAKYPPEQKQSAVLAALRIAQEEHEFLSPEIMDAVASYLGMPSIAVYEVATFYTMFELRPVARNIINVCTNISCMLCSCSDVVNALEQRLNIKLGETTVDGRFTLRSVECLGACVNAPVIQINKNYHEHVSQDNIDQILEQYP